MATERRAQVIWRGDLMSGSGRIENVTSGAIGGLDVSWPARSEDPGGKTSPEELIAAAHATCFAMSVAGELRDDDAHIHVTANVVMDEVPGKGHQIVESQLRVRVRADVDRSSFREAVKSADEGCPFSALIKASAKVSIDAELEG